MYVSMSVHLCDTDMFNELAYTCIIHVCVFIFWFQYCVFVSTCEHIWTVFTLCTTLHLQQKGSNP